MKNFFEELKRRNVIKAAIAYVVVAWVVLQVVDMFTDLIEAPLWVAKILTILIFLGFPIWIIFSWVYEATTEGVKRTSEVQPGESMSHVINKRLNILIVAMLGVAIGITLLFGNTSVFNTSKGEKVEILEASIAIIPFDDMSSAGDSQWFCDGIADDILTHLAQISGMKVISRTSSERYKDTDKSVPEIATELGVNYLIEGSVSKHEDQIMINVQLIDKEDDHIWAEIYREDWKEVFNIRERISREIANRLKVAITPEEDKQLQKVPTKNMEAYELVVKVKGMIDQNDPKLRTSIEQLLDKAIQLDSTYADAYALKAQNYWFHFESYGYDALEKAKELTERSLEIDPDNAMGFMNMSIISSIDLDFKAVTEWIDKALERKPNDAQLNEMAYHAFTSQELKDTLRAFSHIEKAHELDPFSISINRTYYEYLNKRGLYKAADDHLEISRTEWDEDEKWWLRTWWKGVRDNDPNYLAEALQEQINKDPENPKWYRELARYFDGVLNDNKRYLKYSKKAYELNLDEWINLRQYANALEESGKYEEALRIWDTVSLERFDIDDVFLNQRKGLTYYYGGEYEKALEILDDVPDVFHLQTRFFALAMLKREIELDDYIRRHKLIIEPNEWAFYYAIRGKRDSMYYFLDHPEINPQWINSRFEFDPYRNEDRYKDFLQRNNFPVPGEYDPSELEIKQPRPIEVEGR